MTLPALSKTTTGGAAVAASSGFTVRGRCRSQTLSWASTAKLEASPSFHFASGCGHARSTVNVGRLRTSAGPLPAWAHTETAAPAITATSDASNTGVRIDALLEFF